ncbi:MAG: ABC transporter ATP-binding protein [Burkholderiales bacterium]|nr:ABC transporter ATP-binding protein [Burkholderiales bacterium]
MSTVLKVEGLKAGYGKSEVLHGIDLHVDEGKLVSLIGSNGAGKTTLMRAVSGMIRPRDGQVTLKGSPVAGMAASRIVRLGLAHCPEGRHVFAPLTVEDNLLLGAYRYLPGLFGYAKKAKVQLDRMYALFPRLSERRKQLSGTLSGGEQQMLAIGRALMSEPSVLLLDEPSMGLAPVMVDAVFETIRNLKQQGITILLVEQFAHMALQVADYVYVVERGSVALSGTPEEMKRDPRLLEAYLG